MWLTSTTKTSANSITTKIIQWNLNEWQWPTLWSKASISIANSMSIAHAELIAQNYLNFITLTISTTSKTIYAKMCWPVMGLPILMTPCSSLRRKEKRLLILINSKDSSAWIKLVIAQVFRGYINFASFPVEDLSMLHSCYWEEMRVWQLIGEEVYIMQKNVKQVDSAIPTT